MYCNYLKILKKITGNTNATDEIFILKQTICNSYYRTDLIHIIEQCVIRTNIHQNQQYTPNYEKEKTPITETRLATTTIQQVKRTYKETKQ